MYRISQNEYLVPLWPSQHTIMIQLDQMIVRRMFQHTYLDAVLKGSNFGDSNYYEVFQDRKLSTELEDDV